MENDDRSLSFSECPRRIYVYLIATVAAVGGLLMGYHLVVIGGALIFLAKEFALGPAAVGFTASSTAIGCLIGPPIAGTLGDRFGRKRTLALAGLLFAVAALGGMSSTNLIMFNSYRILGGMGVGMVSVVSPMYIAEVSPSRIRGSLVTLFQMAVVIGGFLSVIVCYGFSLTGNWKWMVGAQVIPAALFLLGMILVPESPLWLLAKGRPTEATQILTRINGSRLAEQETRAITLRMSSRVEEGGWGELFRPNIRSSLFVAIALGLFQQWTGAGTLFLYAPIILQKAGFHKAQDALMQTVILNAWNFGFTLIAFWLVDRVGRRPLLLFGTAGMAIGFILMGVIFKLSLSGWYVLLIMIACVGTYAVSLGPLPWLIMSETFPTRLRGRAMAVGSCSVWIALFTANQAFPPLAAHLEKRFGTAAGVFWIFSAVCMAAFVFAWRMVPETRGKSLEELARFGTKAQLGPQ
jgi:MFS transporter, SP family, arabinose:H+ symporter